MRTSLLRSTAIRSTTLFHPVMYGSGLQVLTGIIRALPDPESAGPVRAVQVARRFPKMVRWIGEVAASSASEQSAEVRMTGSLADRLVGTARPKVDR